MAATRSELWLTTSRIRLINIVTFLMLSAVAVADEGNSTRQCYWCGPIAELVHRSEAPPPCGPDTVVFTCQKGHNYCAIAASLPPYVVSRFCSKVYQDECYPQYCNTTRKWRMTCTCRGDLCNQNITKRELDAFETLRRDVEAKESRPKRNTNSANLVLSDDEKTVIVTNLSAAHSDEDLANAEENDHVTQLAVPDPKLNVQIISKDEDLVTSAPTSSESIEIQTDDNGTEKADDIHITQKNVITEISVMDVLMTKVVIDTTKMTKANEAPINANTASPSEKLPTAEALQQEASSENDDTTEQTTVDIEPTESGTSEGEEDDDGDDNHVTVEPSEEGENSANTSTAQVLMLANGLLLQFIYNRK